MNYNLPMKKNNSFLEKIKYFFRGLFKRKNKQEIFLNQTDGIRYDRNKETNKDLKNELHNSIKVEVNNDYLIKIKRENYIKNLENNPDLLYGMSLHQLKKIEAYYIKTVEEKEKN